MSPRGAGRRPSGLESVLGAIARTAARLCEASDALIHLVEGDHHRLVAKHGRLAHFQRLGDTHAIRPDTPLGRAVLERRPVHVHDVQAARRTRFRGLVQLGLLNPRIRTLLVMPLLRDGEALGGIVIRRARVQPFTTKQVALLRAFADQAAIAIENARLSQRLEDRNRTLTQALERQTATAEILRIISESPTDLAPVLKAVAERAARLCDAANAVFYRLDPHGVLTIAASHGPLPTAAVPSGGLPLSRDYPSGRAVLDRRTVRVADLGAEVHTEFPGARAVQAAAGIRSVVATPLLREGTPVGALLIRRSEMRPFTDGQVALLKIFASQAVIAIENVRLFTELQARNRELTEALEQQTATSEILRVISSSPGDLAPVFETILANGIRLCEAQRGILMTCDGDVFQTVAHRGLSPEALAYFLTRGRPGPLTGLGRMQRERQPVHIPDILDDPAYAAGDPDRLSTARLLGARTVLWVPILHATALVGALVIYREEVRPFTGGQIALLQTFADQAVIAIENVRLFTELQARNRALAETLEQQTATAEILRAISDNPTELQPVLDTIARNAARVCEAADASVGIAQGASLRVAAHFGPLEIPVGFEQPLDRLSVIGRSILDRETLHVADASEVPESEFPRTRELARRFGHRTALATPLLREGVASGGLYVRRTEVRPFTDAQIALLKTFADQAVIAIENVRLFAELQRRNRALSEALEQQTATSEILRVISSSPTDTQPVFDAIVRNAVRLCGAIYGGCWRYEGGLVDLASHHDIPPDQLEGIRRMFPRPIGEDPIHGVAGSGRTLDVPDVEQFPVWPETLERWRARGVRSLLVVPMRRDAEVVGAIALTHREVGAFSPRQVELLRTFADQAVIAIENVRLFKALEARNADLTTALEQQTATSEILRVISGAQQDAQPVFETIVRSAVRLCDGATAAVFRVDGGMLHEPANYGGAAEVMDALRARYPRPLDMETTPGIAVLTRSVVQVPDNEDPSALEFFRLTGRLLGVRSSVTVPMLREGDAVGAIVVTRREPGRFSDADVELLKTFADQAVIAVENVRLFKELQARNQELTDALDRQMATADILQVISRSQTDVRPVFEAIADSAMRLFRAWGVAVFRFDGEWLHLEAVRGGRRESNEEIQGLYPRPLDAGGVVHSSIERRAVHHVVDAQAADQDPQLAEIARIRGFRSSLTAPMLREGEPVGAIGISRAEVRPFSEAEIDLLRTFADQAVIAIENARLFSELQQRTAELGRSVEQLRALSEVGQAVSSTLDLDAVLQAIVTRAAQLAGTRGCSIWEYDERAEVFSLRATTILDPEIEEVLRSAGLRKGEGSVGRAALTRAPVQIPDVSAAGAYEGPLRDALIRAGGGSVLALPLLHEDRLLGGLTVSRRATGEFPPEAVALLSAFATQSAIALQNARLFRELEAKSRELEIASRHKSQFLANMSHELRTPLNAILGYGEMMADGIYGELPTPVRDVLGRVDASGRHLLGLINDVLDLSKIEAGQLALAMAEYSMQEVVQTVVASVEALAATKGLALAVDMAPDLPTGRGDQRRLTQVLLNLVGNALKFTEQGGVGVRVTAADGTFEVSVRDTGPGIAAADQERIFEEFQQADTATTRPKGGTGLGLAIARRIVAMHGGRLWVESVPGEGSTFRFTVPVQVERAAVLATGGTA